MKIFTQIKDAIRARYIALVILYTTFLARKLDKSLQYLGKLGVLDLSQPLINIVVPKPAPQPTVEDAVISITRKKIQIPYVPSWVAASFKDRTKHPGFGGTLLVKEGAKDVKERE
jgi:hypothetical protein